MECIFHGVKGAYRQTPLKSTPPYLGHVFHCWCSDSVGLEAATEQWAVPQLSQHAAAQPRNLASRCGAFFQDARVLLGHIHRGLGKES
eukprot:1159713-Pelagomonas_calceolata.AAC.12